MCDIMEQKDKAKEEIEEKFNEIHQLSLQQADFIDQINDANQELVNLWIESERLQNDLNIEKQTNERMMKSQESMNKLNEKS